LPFTVPKRAAWPCLGSRDWDPARRHPWTTNLVFWLRENGWAR
jgi:hypothetical protein